VSFRLDRGLLDRIEVEAKTHAVSMTTLVASLLDEGLKTRRFPGIVYRDGPAGRRAGVVGGPDVWEIIRALKVMGGSANRRVQRLAGEIDLDPGLIRAAVDFYAAFPEEIDERIALDEQAARRVEDMVASRQKLLGL
jgi:hypothetical protein